MINPAETPPDAHTPDLTITPQGHDHAQYAYQVHVGTYSVYLDAGEQVGPVDFAGQWYQKHECDEAAQKRKLKNRRSWLQKLDEHVGDQCQGVADH